MGTWGCGILQNDTAQDNLCEVIHGIYADVITLGSKPPGEVVAARIGAGVGLLLQLSAGYWFRDDGPYWESLRNAILEHESFYGDLSPEADRLLASVIAGQGSELAAREAPPDVTLGRALFATDSQGFSMERTFGFREPALFAHPEAGCYVQEVADQLVSELDEGFDDDDQVSDLCRESEFMACLAVLLVLEPCRVDADHFACWRARFRKVLADQGDLGEEGEFFEQYNACVEQAFAIGIARFSQS